MKEAMLQAVNTFLFFFCVLDPNYYVNKEQIKKLVWKIYLYMYIYSQ